MTLTVFSPRPAAGRLEGEGFTGRPVVGGAGRLNQHSAQRRQLIILPNGRPEEGQNTFLYFHNRRHAKNIKDIRVINLQPSGLSVKPFSTGAFFLDSRRQSPWRHFPQIGIKMHRRR
jgi:hypothetical protein